MADYFPTLLTKQFVNNSPQPSTVTESVIQVVIDGKLVIDPKDINPGVVIDNRP